MTKFITVNETTVNEIQLKDACYQTSKNVITQMIEAHAADENPAFLNSKIFMQYQEMNSRYYIDFEKAKNAMFEENVPDELKPQVKNWNLDYNTCILTLQCRG